jgi:cytochrome c556
MRFSIVAGFFGLALAASLTTVAIAETPQNTREKLMEEIGKQAKLLGPMLQGKVPFDAATAKAAAELMAKDARDFPNHFPEGSDTGDTDSLPAIWANKADFEAKAVKFADDAATTAAATDQGEEAFKVAAGAMFGNCKGCHEKYRKPD